MEPEEEKKKKYQDSYGWGGEGSKSAIKILLLQISKTRGYRWCEMMITTPDKIREISWRRKIIIVVE